MNGNDYLIKLWKVLLIFFFQRWSPQLSKRFVISYHIHFILYAISRRVRVFLCVSFFTCDVLIVCFLFIVIMCRMLSVFCIRPFTYVYYEGANLSTSGFFLGNKSGIRSIFVHVLFVSSWSKTCKRKSSCSQILLAPNYNVVL